MSSQAIFEQSLKCLLAHCHPEWGDRTPLDVFSRLLAKNVRPSSWTPNTHLELEPGQVTSRKEQWSTDTLAKLTRGHSSAAGNDFDCPIVIAEYEGKQWVLDGNHRINRWVLTKDTRLHDVHIHTIAIVGQFVELPPITQGT